MIFYFDVLFPVLCDGHVKEESMRYATGFWLFLCLISGLYCGLTGTPPTEFLSSLATGILRAGLGEICVYAAIGGTGWIIWHLLRLTWRKVMVPIAARWQLWQVTQSPFWAWGELSREQLDAHFPPEKTYHLGFSWDDETRRWSVCLAI